MALTREKLGTFGLTDLWAHAIVSNPFFAANFIASIYIPYMLTTWVFQNLTELKNLLYKNVFVCVYVCAKHIGQMFDSDTEFAVW